MTTSDEDYKTCMYDGIMYQTCDSEMRRSILAGTSQPSTGEMTIVNRYLSEHPDRNRNFVDIGAHIGTTLLPYARHYKHGFGFEANPTTFQSLKANITNNFIKNVSIYNNALSDKVSQGVIVRHNSHNNGCFYYQPIDGANGSTLLVNAITLDSTKLEDVDFIKIDIEGSELTALKGAIEILKRDKPLLQIEINNLSEKNFGISRQDLETFLEELGYQLYGICNDHFYHVPIDKC